MIFFIAPAYNEEANMDRLFAMIDAKMRELKADYRIVVVDDGSTDGTGLKVKSYIKRLPVVLLRHPRNMNVGQVFRTGFKYVLAQGWEGDIVVTKEADNTGDIEILKTMLDKIGGGYDMALASCYAKGGGIAGATPDRVILSRAANTILRTVFPIKGVRTYSSFYRAYNFSSLKKAFGAYGDRLIEEDGFVCMVEMLIKMANLGMNIADVPMVLRCNLRQGRSKINKTRTIIAYLGFILKGVFRPFHKRRINNHGKGAQR